MTRKITSVLVKVNNNPTLCIDYDLKKNNDFPISPLLESISSFVNLSASRLRQGTTVLSPTSFFDPYNVLYIESNGMLKGGKGGFGAMLRSAGKGAGSKPTTDFGSCRDLHGRRLRHVNQEIAISKWKKNESSALPSSKIEGWHLAVPSWAEGVASANKQHHKYKTVLCKRWKDSAGSASKSDPASFGCRPNCDFAHGPSELRGEGLIAYQNEQQAKEREAAKQLEKSLVTNDFDKVSQQVSSAVLAGLKRKKGKKRKAVVSEQTTRGSTWVSCSKDPEAVLIDEAPNGSTIISGGASLFSTAVLEKSRWVDLSSTTLSYEVELITDGVIQIGWGSSSADFENSSATTEDGVGDIKGSWAYDGSRCMKFNVKSSSYGESTTSRWSAGDIVRCCFTARKCSDGNGDEEVLVGSVSFTLNGKSLGVAFDNIIIVKNVKVFPAISLESGETVRISNSIIL